MTGYIYAIEAANGFVKIGWSKYPEVRLSHVRSHATHPCEMVGYVEGTVEHERALHEMLRNERHYGEWYNKGPGVRLFLDLLPKREIKVGVPRGRGPADSRRHPLTKWRNENAVSITDLARKIGVSESVIGRIERRGAFPTPAVAEALMEVTGGRVNLGSAS